MPQTSAQARADLTKAELQNPSVAVAGGQSIHIHLVYDTGKIPNLPGVVGRFDRPLWCGKAPQRRGHERARRVPLEGHSVSPQTTAPLERPEDRYAGRPRLVPAGEIGTRDKGCVMCGALPWHSSVISEGVQFFSFPASIEPSQFTADPEHVPNTVGAGLVRDTAGGQEIIPSDGIDRSPGGNNHRPVMVAYTKICSRCVTAAGREFGLGDTLPLRAELDDRDRQLERTRGELEEAQRHAGSLARQLEEAQSQLYGREYAPAAPIGTAGRPAAAKSTPPRSRAKGST
jgi:hypothetical protein